MPAPRRRGSPPTRRAIARLPRYVLGPAAATAVRGRVTRAQLGAEADPAFARRRPPCSRCSRSRPSRSAPRSIAARSGPDRGAADDRARAPGVAGLPAGVLAAGSTVDVVVSGLRVRTAADGRRFEVGEARAAAQSWRPAPDPRGAGHGGRLRLVSRPGHRLAPSRAGWPAADHDGAPWIEDRSASSANRRRSPRSRPRSCRPLRSDAAIGCAPRRTDLPARATAGVECRVNGAVVGRVGRTAFADARDAAPTYLERLASYGSSRRGDCPGGKSGDAPGCPATGSWDRRPTESPRRHGRGSSVGSAAFSTTGPPMSG